MPLHHASMPQRNGDLCHTLKDRCHEDARVRIKRRRERRRQAGEQVATMASEEVARRWLPWTRHSPSEMLQG